MADEIKVGMTFMVRPTADDPPETATIHEIKNGVAYFENGLRQKVADIRPPDWTPIGLSTPAPDFRDDTKARQRREAHEQGLVSSRQFLDKNKIKITSYSSLSNSSPPRGKLMFTVGIARCGKSTYCNRWVKYIEDPWPTETDEARPPRAIVCGDDIRLALHGDRFNRHAEPQVWATHTYMCKALLLRGHNVIIDGTNTTEDSIWRILNIDADASFHLVDTHVVICKERAVASGHLDLVEAGVIDRQWRQLQDLKDQEGGVAGVIKRIRERVKNRWPQS